MMRGSGDNPRYCHVLVIDDDTFIRRAVGLILEESGHKVSDCPDGSSARESFLKASPDVVLLDVLLPGKDGFSVCQEIRSTPEGKNVPIIMMTGLNDIESIHKAYAVGATDFICKPTNWQILVYRVQYIFRASKAFMDLRISEARLHKAQQLTRMGSWEWSPRQNHLHLSETCLHVIDMPVVSQPLDIEALITVVHPLDRPYLRKALDALIGNGIPLSIDCQMGENGEEKCFIHLEAEISRNSATNSPLVIGTVQDITARKRAEEQISFLAYYDNLTSLPNRVLFKDRLRRAIVSAQKNDRLLAVLFIDLDRFKGINDSLGHNTGDLLLQQVADRLQEHIRSYDTVSRASKGQSSPIIARLGGDEFTILLESISAPEIAAMVARRVMDAIESPFFLNGNEVHISCSIGISIYPHDGNDMDALIKNADIAMYCSKDMGRSTFKFYDREMNDALLQRLALETCLRKAIENNEFSLCYQPKVECSSNKIVGAEVLLRWHNPELGWISPTDFIPIAEDMGLIVQLDRWVITTVCNQLEKWRNQGLSPISLAVNLSAKHFARNNLHGTIQHILDRNEAAQGNLELEITEGVFMEHTEETLKALALLIDAGVNISIDDFGTGYSSLSYLSRLPFHTLKVDKSFVSRLSDNEESAAIISTIISLAILLGKEVVAEGVETIQQLEFLQRTGCTIIQGYLFSRPLPEFEFLALLLEGHIAAEPRSDYPTTGQLIGLSEMLAEETGTNREECESNLQPTRSPSYTSP